MNKNSISSKNNDENLDFYIKKIQSIPILPKDEEYILAKKFKEKNDINTAKKIIESNITYVIKIARKYSNYGLTIKDLIQEGLIGLIKALKNFDPDKNYRFISFAIYWIKSEIQEYIIRNLKIVKIASTKSQKRLFFNLKKIKKTGHLNTEEKKCLSNFLNTKIVEINYMESQLNNQDIQLTINKNNINTDEEINNINILQNKNDPQTITEQNDWDIFLKNKLKKAISKLDKRSRDVLEKRWLIEPPKTLKKIAKIYNLSSERIRQIENNAIKKLRFLINSDN